jgi:hypothetical protein
MIKPHQCSRITLFYGRKLKYPPKQITKTRTELKWLMNESFPRNMINDPTHVRSEKVVWCSLKSLRG